MGEPPTRGSFALWWALAAVAALAACGSGPPAAPQTGHFDTQAGDGPSGTPPADAGADSTEPADTSAAAADNRQGPDDATDENLTHLAGTVRGENGALLVGQTVTCCTASICLVTTSDDAGHFALDVPRLQLALKVPEDVFGVPPRAELLVPVLVTGPADRDLGTLYAPNLPELLPVDPSAGATQTLLLGDGLQLQVQPADLSLALGAIKEGQLGARQVPPSQVPSLLQVAGEKVLAVYVVYPFGSTSTSPIGVRVPGGQPFGGKVWVRSLSPLDGSASAPVPLLADGKGLATAEGAGIFELTWLVVTVAM
ncbi:MAG: hypothetical protein HY902_09560 [Deltaproteobacteria bacterium]|nr:hypothetical protein [Deltaproteobacteria bacterium]